MKNKKFKKAGLILSAAVLSVCLLTGVTTTALAAPATYSSYVNVASQGSGLVIEPTLVLEPSAASQLTGKGYASAVFTPDAEMQVDLGVKQPFKTVFDRYLKGKTIPVLRLDETTVQPFLDWLNKTYVISDIMAISSDVAVLEKIYADERGYLVNTVYDLTDEDLTADRYDQWENIAAANKAGCNILMYSVQENFPVVAEYVSAMSKVCWAEVGSEEEGAEAIAAGCYGVVADDAAVLKDALGHFKQTGFARAQYIAAHRGITKYANEQSLTSIMAAYNEGATHVEIDVQITSDGYLVSCHDNDISRVTGVPNRSIVNMTYDALRAVGLNNYSARYKDTFASLDEICSVLQKTDVILIMELKLDSASVKASQTLNAIERIKENMERFPGMKGHWIAITFFAPYAKGMKELLPEIPCCYLGAGESASEKQEGKQPWDGEHKSMTDVAGKIAFLRKRNIGLDENFTAAANSTASNYLARGYVQNTWTYDDLSNFNNRTNIATTNKAEQCAMLVKEVAPSVTELSEEQLSEGKARVPCRTYNGWEVIMDCEIIEISRSGDEAKVLFYCVQEIEETSFRYGLYSMVKTVTIG